MKVSTNILICLVYNGNRSRLHLHQEALVVLLEVAVGLQQGLQMLPQPRSSLRVLRTQPVGRTQRLCEEDIDVK